MGRTPAIGRPRRSRADNVVLLYRPDMWDGQTPREGEVDLVLAKGAVIPKRYTVGHQLVRGKFIDLPIDPMPQPG